MRLRQTLLWVLVALAASLCLATPTAGAVALTDLGALDPSFGAAGVAWGPDGGAPFVLAAQPSGDLLVGYGLGASGMAIVRLGTDGVADATFGAGGVVSAPVTGFTPHDLAVAADGSFAVVGITRAAPEDIGTGTVARYDANGTLIGTFDGDGVATVDPFAQGSALLGVALTADGDVIVTGRADRPDADPAGWYALATRLDATGAVDPTFGNAGVLAFTTLRTPKNGSTYSDDFLSTLRLRSDGSYLVAAEGDPFERDVVVMTADGQIDTTACGGRWTFDSRSGGSFDATADGVVRTERIDGATSYDATVDRAICDGTGVHPDATFGDSGRVVFGVPWSIDQGYGLITTASGAYVVVGYAAGDAAGDDLLLARVSAAGQLDTSVGRAGLFTVDLGGNERAWYAVEFPDGRVAVAFAMTNGPHSGGVALVGPHILDTQAPSVVISRPLDGGRYGTLGVRSIRGTSDDGTGQIARTQVALRLRRANGTCAWMGKTRWVDGSCASPRWRSMGLKRSWVWDLPRRLRTSDGAARYTAFARADDTAGNGSRKIAGVNLVRFEIGL